MSRIDTLSQITGGRIERAAIVDLQDLRAELEGIELRISELNNQLGTLGADIKIKTNDYSRSKNLGYASQARAILATVEEFKEQRAILVKEREALLDRAQAIKQRQTEDRIAAERAVTNEANALIKPAVKKLLDAFDQFTQADDEYRGLLKSIPRRKNHWPSWLSALEPYQRRKFRESLEQFLKGKSK